MIKFEYKGMPYEWGVHPKDLEPTVVFTMELGDEPPLYGDGTGMMDYVKRFLQAAGYNIDGTFVDYNEDEEVIVSREVVEGLYAQVDAIGAAEDEGDDGK